MPTGLQQRAAAPWLSLHMHSVFSQIDDDVKRDSGAAVPMDALQNEEQLEPSLGRKTELSLSHQNLPADEFTWNIFYYILRIRFVVILLFVHGYS